MEQEGKPQLTTRVLLQSFFDGDEVLKTFGHLTSFDSQMTRMKEIGHPMIVRVASLQRGSGRERERERKRNGEHIAMLRQTHVHTSACAISLSW